MDEQMIERLIALVEGSSLTELEYAAGGHRLRLRKSLPCAGADVTATSAPGQSLPARPAPVAPASSPAQAQAHRVVAGLSGTFYVRPSPQDPPFVRVGDTVAEGQVLAIVEAMKMLNSVESDVSGVVTRICMEDGDAVSAGAEMFIVQPREAHV